MALFEEEQITDTLETTAPSIKYEGNEGPQDPRQEQMLAQLKEEYMQYVFSQNELGEPVMSFEEWYSMVYEASKMGVQAPQEEMSMQETMMREPAAYGGIMDTYTGRRKYGFGSFFKKITKPFKKALKSPIGKLALMGGLGYLATPGTGASIFSPKGKGGWWKKLLMDSVDSSGRSADVLGLLSKGKKLLSNPWVSIPAASAATGLMTAKQPEEDLDNVQSRWDADKAAFDAYLASLDDEDSYRVPDEYVLATGGRVGKQEGGLMDLGGMEKDYRNDGGFVPIGGQEKADDVPARLSRNEFVFTADAVRSAGGGDIDKGAEVMENVMKNLEAGGKVSEESQGKGGAQEMFEVSERLSEVM